MCLHASTRSTVSLMTRDQRDSPVGRTLNVIFERRHHRVASFQSTRQHRFCPEPVDTKFLEIPSSKKVAELFVNSNVEFR